MGLAERLATMQNPEPEYITIKCGRCDKRSSMRVVATYTAVDEIEDEYGNVYPGPNEVLRLTLCPACDVVNLTVEIEGNGEYNVLWPSNKTLLGLPPEIDRAYKAAQKVQRIDSNAFAVLLRRVLELVCRDRGANGDNLYEQLKSLAESSEIPDRLADMADQVRQLGNIGAHASAGELTIAEVPILEDLCRAVLEYVYTAPKLIRQVEQRIEERKQSKAKKSKSKLNDYHINIFNKDGEYVADIPDLRGCSATGGTPTEALQRVEIAKIAWLEKARAEGRRIPHPLYRPG